MKLCLTHLFLATTLVVISRESVGEVMIVWMEVKEEENLENHHMKSSPIVSILFNSSVYAFDEVIKHDVKYGVSKIF